VQGEAGISRAGEVVGLQVQPVPECLAGHTGGEGAIRRHRTREGHIGRTQPADERTADLDWAAVSLGGEDGGTGARD
jgi:hypothetical protein